MNRREFIKVSSLFGAGAVGAPAFLGGCSRPALPGSGEVKSTPTFCDVCFWKCAATVYRENGAAWKVKGNEDDLHSAGRLCTRGTAGLGMYEDRDRLRRPLLRVTGTDGRQTFKEVSWEEALDFVATGMRRVATDHGPDRMALLKHGYGGRHFAHLMQAFEESKTSGQPTSSVDEDPRGLAIAENRLVRIFIHPHKLICGNPKMRIK